MWKAFSSYLLAVFLILVFTVSVSCKKYNSENDHIKRHQKFLSIWGIGLVRFANSVCNSSSNLDGTCYTRRQCVSIAGTISGRCAQNIGVCCVIQYTCGSTSAYNNTYFVSTNYPGPVSGNTRCVYTIQKCTPDICQVRIDFISNTLAQPDGDGNCIFDSMTITGGGSQVPVLCGENSGQHVYVDFYESQDIQITISTSNLATLGRTWNFKVTQIACACPSRAPAGCLQFYTAVSGTVQSFNYGSTASSQLNSLGMTGTRQLVNQNYGVCVAMVPGYCSIVWSQSALNSFTVSNDTEVVAGLIGTPLAGFQGVNCTTDFVVIPAPYINSTVLSSVDRFCGNGIPTLTTYSKPFVLTVINNGDEAGDAANRGFSLDYMQQPCSRLLP